MRTYTAWLALWGCPNLPGWVGALRRSVACWNSAVDQKITTPAGWTAGYSRFTSELVGVTIYDGPPEEGASLVYSNEETATDSVTQTWQLTSNRRGNTG